MSPPESTEHIFALERPHPKLRTLYVIRALLSGPFVLILLPVLLFRYRTLRYRFDDEGIHMRVGILFRREVNLTYARIQDIHLQSGILQRWLGLADIQIQTAAGSAGAELVIEGFTEFEAIRDFLYNRMRGTREGRTTPAAFETITATQTTAGAEGEVVPLLLEIRDELRKARELIEQRGPVAASELSSRDV